MPWTSPACCSHLGNEPVDESQHTLCLALSAFTSTSQIFFFKYEINEKLVETNFCAKTSLTCAIVYYL